MALQAAGLHREPTRRAAWVANVVMPERNCSLCRESLLASQELPDDLVETSRLRRRRVRLQVELLGGGLIRRTRRKNGLERTPENRLVRTSKNRLVRTSKNRLVRTSKNQIGRAHV